MLRTVPPTIDLLKLGTLSKNLIWAGFLLSLVFNEKVIPWLYQDIAKREKRSSLAMKMCNLYEQVNVTSDMMYMLYILTCQY